MARPKKQAQESRSEVARARLTLAERELVRSNAAAAGLTETDYIRARILGERITTSITRTDPALIVALNRVGNNVNQLAVSVHRDSAFQKYWREVGEELRSVLHSTLEGIK